MIEIKNLTFTYSKKSQLYNNLDFKAKEGSIIGLLGKNGAGKSTLLKLMGGVIKAHFGTISIMDHDPFKRKPDFLKEVFYVSEELFIPTISIKNYIKAYSSFYPNFDAEKLQKLLIDFELNPTANLGKQSYGQKKKFIIAFALASNCKLLLMDEPTNGLDIPSKAQFRKVLAGALSEEQIAIISTHQVKDVENLIDRIVLVDHGKVIYNQNILDITDLFAFSYSQHIPEDAVYHEVVPGGYKVITPKTNSDTNIDIELLFNAITQGIKLEIYEPAI